MKKLFISALLATFLISSAFAADVKKVNSMVTTAFASQYKSVKDVEWSIKPEFVKASFILNGKKLEVFYKYDGELIGASSAITIDDLPTAAKRTFAKRYSDYTVKEAIKFETDYQVAYYISAENEKEVVTIEVSDNTLSIFKRVSKK